jgi:hypothetical protein
MTAITCRCCGATSGLVNAHAIPEAFFREVRSAEGTPKLISNVKGQFPKKALIGVYDNAILCATCEGLFGKIDNYGAAVLLRDFSSEFIPMMQNGEIVCYSSSTVDPDRFLRFLVAVLWRASVSTHDFYRRVKLGNLESVALKCVTEPASPIPPVFDAVLSRWNDIPGSPKLATAMLDPYRERWDHVNAYRLYLGRTVAYIKVDKRPFQGSLAKTALSSAPPVMMVTRELLASKDITVMRNIVIATESMRRK